MKKTVGVFSLLVMLLSQVFSPFVYAVSGDETLLEETIVEEIFIEEAEVLEEATIEEAIEPENSIADDEIVIENKEGDENNSGVVEELAEIQPEISSGDVESQTGVTDKYSCNLDNLPGEQENLKEEVEILTGVESGSGFFETIKEGIKNLLGIWNDENSKTNEEAFESKEIYGTGEYGGVKVEVYAQTGLFASGIVLTIEPVVEEKLNQVKEALLSGEVEMVEEEEEQTVIAFDITFRDPATQEELQPKDGTVQVKFNYEENENLVQAEEKEDQEVKVYHLNDIDEEGNKIEELTGTIVEEVLVNEEESEDENVLVVEAEKFSIYAIIKGASNVGDSITITYNANGGKFKSGDSLLDLINVIYTKQANGDYKPNINIQAPDKKATSSDNCSGWMFDGWYTDATNQITEWLGIAADTTNNKVVYAKWLPFNDKIITMDNITFTIMDRNMGATDFSSGYSYYTDQTNLARAGKYYQFGNNYGFRNDVNYQPNTSQEQVDLTSFGILNPYYSSVFRMGNERWDSSPNSYYGNQKIWGAYSANDDDKKGPCPEGYHIPARDERNAVYKSFYNRKLTNEGISYCNNIGNGSTKYCIPAVLGLPLAGRIDYTNALKSRWKWGMYYWSSDYSSYDSYFYTTTHWVGEGDIVSSISRAYGMSLRCFKNTYSKPLSFNPNGGSVTTSINKVYRRYEGGQKLPTPTNAGKIFAGWFITPDFQGTPKTVNKFTEYESGGSVTLYAKRKDPSENKTIIFNANGGYFSGQESTKQVEYSEQVESGNYVGDINIQAPYKEIEGETGFMFDGWYIDTNYSSEWKGVTSETLSGQMVYAKWLPFKDMDVTLSGTTITLMDRNLGATVVGGRNTVGSYGKYYQWGNNYGFHDLASVKYSEFQIDAKGYGPGNYYYSNVFIKNSNGWQAGGYGNTNESLWDGEGPCPKGYHVPSKDERVRLKLLFKSWRSSSQGSSYCNSLQYTSEGACFSEKLKMPIPGFYYSNLSLNSTYGYYWSSTSVESNNARSFQNYGLGNGSYIYTDNYSYHSNALSVRCFKDPSTTLTFVLDNGEDNLVISGIKWRVPLSSYKPEIPIKTGYRFLGWYDGDNVFEFSGFLDNSKTIEAKREKNPWYTYNATSGRFESGNFRTIKYLVNTIGYSHTPNINNKGEKLSDYENNIKMNEVITITGAENLHITITYGGEGCCDWVAMWTGSHPEYTAENNYNNPKSLLGTDGRLYGGVYSNPENTKEYHVLGDTVTIAYKSDGSACGGYGNGYGYYAYIEGDNGDYYTDEESPMPFKTGYHLGGRYTGEIDENNNLVLFQEAFDVTGTEVTEDRILYAKWNPNNYTIKFHSNNGDNNVINQSFTYDLEQKLAKNNYIYNGYTFLGRNTQQDGSGTGYLDEQLVLNLTGTDNGIIDLYAQWNEDIYNIEYNLGVDELLPEGEINPIKYTVNSGDITLINPVKIGYTFTGWTGTDIEDKVLTLTIPQGSTGNRSYTPQFQENSYTIKYVSEEGTGNMEDVILLYTEEKLIAKNKYIRTGYQLSYWLDKDTGLMYYPKQKISKLTGDDNAVITLTAQWSLIPPAAGGGKSIAPAKEQEHNVAEEQKQEEKEIQVEVEQVPSTTNNSSTQSTTRTTTNTSVDPLILSAYEWAYEHNITTISSLKEADPDGTVTRGHLAKMVVNYATNVLGQEIPEKIPSECRWNDWRGDWESEEIKDYAVKSCELGLMGLDMPKFLPNMQVTRAQFGTIMSRLLWGKKYAGGTPYYRKHLNALKENGIMTQIDNPEKRVELRQWVWLMLMRSAQNK